METIALRKYSISIVAHKNAPQMADNVLRDFDCAISEPSIWLLPGSTTAKGLSFLDKKGNPLNSSIFKNQAFFNGDDAQAEEKSIEKMVYGVLFDSYSFEKSDTKVIVTKY